jgi:hypothetical protein
LELELSKQTEYQKLIESCQEQKRRLYELYVLQELNVVEYKTETSKCEAELAELKRIHALLAARTERLRQDKETSTRVRKIADEVKDEQTLTRGLVETLIDKVYVYPGNRVEVCWKLQDFYEASGLAERGCTEGYIERRK